MIFTKKKSEVLSPYEAAKTFRADLDSLIGATLAARVSRRELATLLQSAADGLLVNDALVRPVL